METRSLLLHNRFNGIDLCLQILTSVWLCSQGHCTLCMRRMWQWRGFPVIASVLLAWCLPMWLWTQPTQASVSLLEIAWTLACWMSAFVKMVGSTLCCCFSWKEKTQYFIVRWMCLKKLIHCEWVLCNRTAVYMNMRLTNICNVILTESLLCLGAPIIMSSPHFYQADKKFVQDVLGMKPNKEQHKTTIDINPVGISTLTISTVSTSWTFFFLFYTNFFNMVNNMVFMLRNSCSVVSWFEHISFLPLDGKLSQL